VIADVRKVPILLQKSAVPKAEAMPAREHQRSRKTAIVEASKNGSVEPVLYFRLLRGSAAQ
jgi:hypothetical protein